MQIKCTSCGATQELAANHQCGFCGNAIEQEKAQENYKASSTGEVGNLMMMADTAVDATNWEEALQYYNRVLEKDISNSDAWLGKGIAMVYTSKIGDIKTKEAIAYWKNAIKHAKNPDSMGKRVAKEINTVVNAFYPAIENHYIEFNDLDNSYQELVSRFDTLENALDYATQLDKGEISYPETGYELCKRVIELPTRFASTSKSAAQIEGFVGQLTNNKYAAEQARRDSSDKVNAANRRLSEIAKASLIIDGLLEKYVKLISDKNPNHRAIQDLEEKKVKKQLIKENKMKDAQRGVSFIVAGLAAGIGMFIGNSVGLFLNDLEIYFGDKADLWLWSWFIICGVLGYVLTNKYWNVISEKLNKKE